MWIKDFPRHLKVLEIFGTSRPELHEMLKEIIEGEGILYDGEIWVQSKK